MAKKNFDRLLNMDTAKVLEEVQAGNPGLAARMVSERVVDAPLDVPFPLKLVPPASPSALSSADPTTEEPSGDTELEHTTVSRKSAPRPETTIHGRRGIVTRASGREVARLFCYVEPQLYREVRMYCAQHDVSISDLVNGVLVDALRRKLAAG
jgi:hypothetical protein